MRCNNCDAPINASHYFKLIEYDVRMTIATMYCSMKCLQIVIGSASE